MKKNAKKGLKFLKINIVSFRQGLLVHKSYYITHFISLLLIAEEWGYRMYEQCLVQSGKQEPPSVFLILLILCLHRIYTSLSSIIVQPMCKSISYCTRPFFHTERSRLLKK